MEFLEKSDKEIQEIAQPIWDNLVNTSNIKDYGGFTKDFSSQMLYGANEVELGKQWANNKLLTSLAEKQQFLGVFFFEVAGGVMRAAYTAYAAWCRSRVTARPGAPG